jgi:ribonuclease BN (tRNA processing enzyme)
VKIQLLPSSFDDEGRIVPEQRLTCYLIDDRVAIDAGSVALGLTHAQRRAVRDLIITHPHIDHIATLPILIDDLFAALEQPLRIHATAEVIEQLERDIFNWTVYPRFSELCNDHGPVMEYVPLRLNEETAIAHLRVTPVPVNHIVSTIGMVIADGKTTLAFSSDTAETDDFWDLVNRTPRLDALLIECSFPNSMGQLAAASKHLTPATLATELRKLRHRNVDIFIVHIKPMYRETVLREIGALTIPRLHIMEPGRSYEW